MGAQASLKLALTGFRWRSHERVRWRITVAFR